VSHFFRLLQQRGVGMCCCCGTRHGQLLLGFLALFCLFSNLNLIHLTSVLHPTTPDRARAFASLSSLHPGRFKREISSIPSSNISKWDDGHPIANDEDGKGPIPVEKVTPKPDPTTLPPSTFLFSNPPSTPSTTTSTKSTPSMKWPETTTETAEEETTESEKEDDVTQLINKEDPKRDVKKEQKSFWNHWSLDMLLRLCFFACAGLGMALACTILLFLPTSINPAHIAFGALLLSALVTGWQPFLNYHGAAIARVIQGLCLGLSLPLATCIVVHWAPIRHRAFFLCCLLLSYPLSILGPWPLTQLLSDFDLPYWMVYAISAGLTVITAGLVMWRYKEHPCDHYSINGAELNDIRAGKAKEEFAAIRALPNHRSTSFWITTAAFYGFFLALVIPSFYLPSLLACPELMSTWNLGVTAAIPYAGFFVLFFLMSWLPYSPISSRVLNTIGLIVTGILFFLLPLLIHPERNIMLPIVLIPLGLLAGGVVHLAVNLATLRLLPSLSLSICLAHLTAPLFIHLLVPDNLRQFSWSSAFSAVSIIIAVCCAPFVIAAKAQLFPPKRETTLRNIDDDEECGLQEMHELPPAGKHLQ
ncbi:hypothetical protein PFISCL1PPCAC_28693, partial [Pristionchus fissidentatus]